MPSMTDTISRLAWSKIYSAVDMEGAFHCVDLEESSRDCTAFSTPFGQFRNARLGFGVTNGPATYSRLVQEVLRGILYSFAISFLDDGFIHSSDLPTHFRNLRTTLHAYRKAGLKISHRKAHFFRDKISFLGHELSAEGIGP